MVKKYLKEIKGYKPGKPINEVKRELGLKKVIKMASNENPFGPPAQVFKEITRAARQINRYPDGQCFYLRKELSKRLDVEPENLVFSNGSDELVVLVLRACLEQGQEVIVGNPTFMIYELQAKASGVTVVKSPMRDFRYNLDDIQNKISKNTKVIFIANPDNPNGTYLKQKELSDFIEGVPEDILVFLDEAYYEFAPGDFPDSLEYLRKGYNVMITRTFSKAYGLAGLRVGFGIGPKSLTGALNKIREPFNVNSLAQAAALAALKNPGYLQKNLAYTNKEKEFICRELDKVKVDYVRSATNFLLISTGCLDSEDVAGSLLKKGFIVRDMNPWGMKNFIRVTVSKHSENKKFIKALQSIVLT